MNTLIGPTDEQLDTMRRNIFEDITSQSRRSTRVRKRVSVRIGVMALATGLIAAILVVGGFSPQFGSRGASARAAEVLTAAAATTITTSDPVVGPGQYLKVEKLSIDSVSTRGESGFVTWFQPNSITYYLPYNDGPGWAIERYRGAPMNFFGQGAEAIAQEDWERNRGRPDDNGVFHEGGIYPRPDTPEDLAAMPRHPQELRDYLYETYNGESASPDEDAWVRIASLLSTGLAPADLRAALYKTAVLIPGVEYIDAAADLDGRTGIALGRIEPSRSERQDIIIDPNTGLLIGERHVLTEPVAGVPAGTAMSSTSVRTSVVDSAP